MLPFHLLKVNFSLGALRAMSNESILLITTIRRWFTFFFATPAPFQRSVDEAQSKLQELRHSRMPLTELSRTNRPRWGPNSRQRATPLASAECRLLRYFACRWPHPGSTTHHRPAEAGRCAIRRLIFARWQQRPSTVPRVSSAEPSRSGCCATLLSHGPCSPISSLPRPLDALILVLIKFGESRFR